MSEKLWDPIRRIAVVATPEERVRQRFVSFLLQRGCPISAIQVEYKVGQKGRFDVAVSAPDGSLWLLAECKAEIYPIERLWEMAWAQLRRYPRTLPLPNYFAVVIGSQIWCWQAKEGTPLNQFPEYPR